MVAEPLDVYVDAAPLYDAAWQRAAYGAGCRAGTHAARRGAVAAVIEAMRADVCAPPTLHEMADIAHMSPFHFSRVFGHVMGASPAEFLSALRVQEAKRLLLTTDLSVTDVCFEMGYRSLGTFTARFTALVGTSPGRLRRRAEEMESRLDSLYEQREPAPIFASRCGAVVRGRVAARDLDAALIFIGLFPTCIPQSQPVAGALLFACGGYRIHAVPDGVYYVLAAALPPADRSLAYLLPHAGLRVAVQGPLLVRHGAVYGDTDLALRPLAPTDPPIVVALPLLA